MSHNEENKVIIGKITTTHGHRGELKVLPLTEHPERFEKMKTVEVAKNGENQVFHIERVRQHKKFFIIKFQEINDMNEALRYKDSLLFIPKSEVKPLPPDRYYHFQLVGLVVYSDDGQYLGKITQILEPGGHDIFVVTNEETGKEVMIPAVKAWVSEIDLENGRVTVKLIPGLL
ncbi:MAG: 16S rRNA processing protein RimM [Thermoanaerobacteraceae bacterium]|nr:16S rRNA processing protein RimM [Thermoanaerobacteraceae bacterium]